jgi:3-oxoacyl-[acyl-carrier-protein] synthase III
VAPFIALHDAVIAGQIKNGMTVLLLGCGTGPVWAACCLKWNGGRIREW